VKQGESSTPVDIWTREVRFEQHDGKPQLHIVQRWNGAAPAYTRTMDSWFDVGTFRPHTHERITEKEGKRVVEGFLFAPDRITGLPALAEGYEAHINFYHPGAPTPPQRYTFKVTGAETIAGPAGPVDCWVVKTDYNEPGEEATFWFAKGSQMMVREQSSPHDGKVLVKTLIE